MSSNQEIQAVIQDPNTSYWLRDALKTAVQFDPLDVGSDAEYLAMLFAKLAQEKAAEAMAWLEVQRAQKHYLVLIFGSTHPIY
jgi:hypothetical protein